MYWLLCQILMFCLFVLELGASLYGTDGWMGKTHKMVYLDGCIIILIIDNITVYVSSLLCVHWMDLYAIAALA